MKLFQRTVFTHGANLLEEPQSRITYGWPDLAYWQAFQVLVARLSRVICLRRAGRQVSSRKLFVSPSLTKLGEKRFRLHGPLGIEQPIHGTVKTGITGWNVREDVNIFFVFFTAGNFIRYTLLDMEIAHPDNCIIQDKRRFFRLSKFDVCVAITPPILQLF